MNPSKGISIPSGYEEVMILSMLNNGEETKAFMNLAHALQLNMAPSVKLVKDLVNFMMKTDSTSSQSTLYMHVTKIYSDYPNKLYPYVIRYDLPRYIPVLNDIKDCLDNKSSSQTEFVSSLFKLNFILKAASLKFEDSEDPDIRIRSKLGKILSIIFEILKVEAKEPEILELQHGVSKLVGFIDMEYEIYESEITPLLDLVKVDQFRQVFYYLSTNKGFKSNLLQSIAIKYTTYVKGNKLEKYMNMARELTTYPLKKNWSIYLSIVANFSLNQMKSNEYMKKLKILRDLYERKSDEKDGNQKHAEFCFRQLEREN